jgi:hypothetical protein
MKVKVKVIAIDLIGRLGGVFITMDLNTAKRYSDKGQVKILDDVINYSYPEIDTETIITFGDTEVKDTGDTGNEPFKRTPAADAPIFPQI